MNANWEGFIGYFQDGIFGSNAGAIICTIFIIGLCAFGLWKARKIFQEI